MAFPDSTRIGQELRMILIQQETARRERCGRCVYLPKKFDDSFAETDRCCDHPKEFRIGQRRCRGRKDYGSAK